MLKRTQILKLSFIIFFLILPYFLFEGKYYIGGDDTRVLYIYPYEYLKNFGLFSWLNYSTSGANAPWQFLAPFLIVWTGVSEIIRNKLILDYLSFSLPLILGFIFTEKLIREIISDKKNKSESILGSAFFILSPIILYDQLFIFLTTVWLLGLFPILFYYFIKYVKSGEFSNVLKAVLWSIFLSLSFFSIPWILGILFPISIGFLITFPILNIPEMYLKIKRSTLFLFCLILTQQFWFLPFISTYILKGQNNYGAKILSKEFTDTISPTVLATATGSILYPIVNLFHRQIAFDFGWYLSNIFKSFYDIFLFTGVVYILIISGGFFFYFKTKDENLRKKFLLFFIIFIISLALFTINIGPFKELFILMSLKIPGFVMFRNFYDKFSMGYVFAFSVLITISLILVKNKINKNFYSIILLVTFIILAFNFLPAKKIINAPLWQTKGVYRNIILPGEYLDFMSKIKQNVSPSSNILSIPMSTAVYSAIKDENDDNVYVGSSLVKTFTGINDYSGNMSFSFGLPDFILDNLVVSNQYDEVADYLQKYNIDYILYTKNIPQELQDASWIYRKDAVTSFKDNVLDRITNSKMFTSSKGNYVFYDLKKKNIAIDGKNIFFLKISSTEYKIFIKNLNKSELDFNDSYHGGWKLYVQKNPNMDWCSERKFSIKTSAECITKTSSKNLFYLKSLTDPEYRAGHNIRNGFSNTWNINAADIKTNYSKDYYKMNPDGSIDVELVLYFQPQNYFLFGTLVSTVSLALIIIYFIYDKKKKH